jgi:predicted membrane protein
MYPAPTSSPSPDATHVPIGRRTALNWGLLGAVSAAIALIGLTTVLRVVIDPVRFADPLQTLAVGLIPLLLFGLIAALCFRGGWRRRRTAIITDYAGLWFTDGLADAVVPWNDVASIGLYENVHTSQDFSNSFWSIELRLHEPRTTGEDPLLDRFVLAAGPPRYLIRLPRGTHIDAMAAIRARAPELWPEAP